MEPEATDLRAEAIERLERKRAFRTHLIVFVAVNLLLWVVWVSVAAATDVWFPWPLFPLLGWGIGLVAHARETFGGRTFSEEKIEREMDRLRGTSRR
jgi:hypothetical protein